MDACAARCASCGKTLLSFAAAVMSHVTVRLFPVEAAARAALIQRDSRLIHHLAESSTLPHASLRDSVTCTGGLKCLVPRPSIGFGSK